MKSTSYYPAFIFGSAPSRNRAQTSRGRSSPVRSMFALRTQRLLAPLSRNALPRLSCARQLCTPAAKPEEPADDGQPKLLYEGGKNKVWCVCALLVHGLALAEVLCRGRRR